MAETKKSDAGAPVEGSSTAVGKAYTGTGGGGGRVPLDDDAQPVIAVGVSDSGYFGARSATGRFMAGCEDFFHGSITCPTCDGTGRVSRDREHELVALIPMSDKRLHPRRTKLYVAISIALCFIVAGMLAFFLFPRSINLRSSQPTIVPLAAGYSENHTAMYMTVLNMYNITNGNFYQVELTSVEASILLNQRILATATNASSLTVSMRSTALYYIQLNATFNSDLDYIIQYCWNYQAGSFLVQFQAMATFSYFQKLEQITLITYQYIHCPKHH